MSIQETREETDARLKAAYEQRVEAERSETVRNGTDADYAVYKAAMLKAAKQVEKGKLHPIPDVRAASPEEYEAAKRLMLRQSLR